MPDGLLCQGTIMFLLPMSSKNSHTTYNRIHTLVCNPTFLTFKKPSILILKSLNSIIFTTRFTNEIHLPLHDSLRFFACLHPCPFQTSFPKSTRCHVTASTSLSLSQAFFICRNFAMPLFLEVHFFKDCFACTHSGSLTSLVWFMNKALRFFSCWVFIESYHEKDYFIF